MVRTLHILLTLQLYIYWSNESDNDGIFIESIIQCRLDCCLVCSAAITNCVSWSLAFFYNFSGCWFLLKQFYFKLFFEGPYIWNGGCTSCNSSGDVRTCLHLSLATESCLVRIKDLSGHLLRNWLLWTLTASSSFSSSLRARLLVELLAGPMLGERPVSSLILSSNPLKATELDVSCFRVLSKCSVLYEQAYCSVEAWEEAFLHVEISFKQAFLAVAAAWASLDPEKKDYWCANK